MWADIGRTTVQRILAEHGIEPAPQRKREYSWATFIKAHLGAIAGMDFFTVEVLTVVGLVRYHVLFVIDIGSRIVEVVGLARSGWRLDEADGAEPARHRRRIPARKAPT
jgi:putative transposase